MFAYKPVQKGGILMTFPQIEFPLRLATHSLRLREKKNPTENVNVFSILFFNFIGEKEKLFVFGKNCILLQGEKSVHTALVHFPRKKERNISFSIGAKKQI